MENIHIEIKVVIEGFCIFFFNSVMLAFIKFVNFYLSMGTRLKVKLIFVVMNYILLILNLIHTMYLFHVYMCFIIHCERNYYIRKFMLRGNLKVANDYYI